MPSRTVLVPPGSLGALDAFRMVSRDMAKISGLQPLNWYGRLSLEEDAKANQTMQRRNRSLSFSLAD